MKNCFRSGACAGLAWTFLLLACPGAHASISTYTTLAAWQAASPSSTVQDFNSVAPGFYNPYSTPADGTIDTTYSYNDTSTDSSGSSGSGTTGVEAQSSPSFGTGQYLAAGENNFNSSGYNGGYTEYYGYLSCGSFSGCSWVYGTNVSNGYGYSYNTTTAIALTPPAGTTSLAFQIGQSLNDSTLSTRDITATVTTADNSTQQLTVNNSAGSLSFFGFSASDAITSVTITAAENPGVYTDTPAYDTPTTYYNDGNGPNTGYYYYAYNDSYNYIDESNLAIDNLMYGVPVPSVPEPSSWILLLTVVGVAVYALHRTHAPNASK
jgi:hypothetical protein